MTLNTLPTFIPSIYQANLFKALASSGGDIIVSAVAGSGKTWSLEEGVKCLPSSDWDNTLMCAFNNHIKAELLDRQAAGRIPSGVKIATLHGLGYGALIKHFQPKNTRTWLDNRKYRRLCEAAWRETGIVASTPESRESLERAQEALVDLVRLSQLTLAATRSEFLSVISHYGIDMPVEWEDVALALVPKVLLWGRQGLPGHLAEGGQTYHPSQCISFDDMVYLPVALGLRMWGYKWLFVDECQDLNEAQYQLLMRISGHGARRCFVGDPNQAIYGFTGASASMFSSIKTRLDAQALPLSVCYRCDQSIVDMASVIVPQIEARPSAPSGLVHSIDQDELLARAARAWREDSGEPYLLLCRCNTPLIAAAFALLRQGVPVWIKGRDIGMTLIRAIEEAGKLAPTSLTSGVAKWKAKHLEGVDPEDEATIQTIQDKASALLVLIDSIPMATAAKVRAKIEELFSDEGRGVVLSSVHKAKGLEADQVGILAPELMPLPFARQAWQREQEFNLIYVAITRAKKELYLAGRFGGMLLSKPDKDYESVRTIHQLNDHLEKNTLQIQGAVLQPQLPELTGSTWPK